MKKIMLISILILFISLVSQLFGCSNENKLSAVILTDEQLYEFSPLIVVGEVIDTKIEKLEHSLTIDRERKDMVVSTLKITEVIKGEKTKGDTIEIAQIGNGTDYKISIYERGGGYFQKGDKLLAFLNTDEESNNKFKNAYNGREMPYVIRGVNTGGQLWLDNNNNIIEKNIQDNQFKEYKTLNGIINRLKEIDTQIKNSSSSSISSLPVDSNINSSSSNANVSSQASSSSANSSLG